MNHRQHPGVIRSAVVAYIFVSFHTALKEKAKKTNYLTVPAAIRELEKIEMTRQLADQIYRTRDNRNFCKLHGIRLSGPKLGRPSLTKQLSKEKKQEYQDNIDRIEVERSFSLSKRCYGMVLYH